jgi:hypothetical protein
MKNYLKLTCNTTIMNDFEGAFKRLLEKEFPGLTLSLANKKRGQVTPVENKIYPEFYLDMCWNQGGAWTGGTVFFEEEKGKKLPNVTYSVNDRAYVFDSQTLKALATYLDYVKENYKLLKG